ncbi:MAG: hypothetical protein ACREOZ_01045 [Gloeomargaritales cyanobacterium]
MKPSYISLGPVFKTSLARTSGADCIAFIGAVTKTADTQEAVSNLINADAMRFELS